MPSADLTLKQFLDTLAARQPTPGGGSASALGGALGAALGSMAALYTTKNEKFKAVEPQALEIDAQLCGLRALFSRLIDSDIAAYEAYAAARRMPKDSPADAAARRAALAKSCEAATQIPEQIVQAALEGFALLERLQPIVNPGLAGDLASAAYFFETAARAAAIQVVSNCSAADTEGANSRRRAEAQARVARCAQARERIDAAVMKMMKL